jgi:D-aminopeptidase
MSSSTLSVDFDCKKVDAIFADLDQCHLAGAAVGVAVRGRPVYRKAFGLASMELPVTLSPTMRMRIGSTSKHFAALAYMLLCEQGRAKLSDPVGKYLPELNPVCRQITMRQLMAHTSGLRDVFDISWIFNGTDRPVSTAELLSVYGDIDDVNGPPDTAWIYNNGGYLMLSVAIERIAGQSLEDLLRETIFDPIGMYATVLRRSDGGFLSNSATLHMTTPTGGYEKSHFFGTEFAGEGGIVSTVDDMLRWLAHMDNPRIGSAATWSTIKSPHRLGNGTSTGYGLGLFQGHYRGAECCYHAGGGMGGNAQMLKVPAVGLDIVVMVNREDLWSPLLVEEILDATLTGLDSQRAAPCGPGSSGTFRSSTTGRVVQLFPRDERQIASVDGMDIPVEPHECGALRPVGIFRYERKELTLIGDPMTPSAIELNDFGHLETLLRLEQTGDDDGNRIVGEYQSNSTGIRAIISKVANGLRLATSGKFGSAEYRLENLADGVWRAKSNVWVFFGGILSFDDSATVFRFSTHRTRALPFHRRA